MSRTTTLESLGQLLDDVRRECSAYDASLEQFFQDLDARFETTERLLHEEVMGNRFGGASPTSVPAANHELLELRKTLEQQTELISLWLEQVMSREPAGPTQLPDQPGG